MASDNLAQIEEARWHKMGYVPFSFGDRVRQARRHPLKGKPRNQQSFADEIGVTIGMLNGWEAGRSQPRHRELVAQRISDATGYRVTWLLGFDDLNAGGGLQTKAGHLTSIDGQRTGAYQPLLPFFRHVKAAF